MSGDFSRWTGPNAALRHYAGVLMQQGRLQTDADWNEATDIAARRMETALGDLIGRAGTPKSEGGFRISSGTDGFAIGAGRYFLDGAMVENPADTTYDGQAGEVAVAPLEEALEDTGEVLVYLEATRPTVTAREDTRLADPALGGVDTAVRIQAAWRVGVEQVELSEDARAELIDAVHCGGIPDLPGWGAPTGRMEAGTLPAGELPEEADCLIPPEAGYLSQENQLYRVQIVRGGTRSQARYVWSRENGSVEAVLDRDPDGNFVLTGARDDEALGFGSGGWVEVYDAADRLHGRSGTLTRLTLEGEIASFVPGIGNFDTMVRPRVRRWDHGGLSAQGLPLATTPVELERGLTVRFTAGTYQEGDFWVFEARAATGQPAWPPYPVDGSDLAVPPMGWGRRRAPLALARWNGEQLSAITDLRAEFPTLTCLHAEDVEFDDDVCNLGAETVQDAIEALCSRTSTGLCSFVAGTVEELQAGVAALPRDASVRICLRGAAFALPRTLVLRDLGHVTVTGMGPNTVLSTAAGEPALLFTNCASVRVVDLSVNGGPTGVRTLPFEEGRRGALSMVECGDVQVERVRARCRNGLERTAACIAVGSPRPRADVLVRDCTLRVGQAQIGVQIIGARRALVENTTIAPVPASSFVVQARIAADPVLVNAIARSVVGFARSAGLARRPGNIAFFDADRGGAGAPAGAFAALASVTDPVAAEGFDDSREPLRLTLPGNPNRSISMRIDPVVATRLQAALDGNRASAIADPAEFRRHITNLVTEAVRNNGFVAIGPTRRRIIPANRLGLAAQSFVAQGIVIAGDSVDEARVTGCRIDAAVDGVRIAASSDGDARPPNWQSRRPRNTVARASIQDCVIALRPAALGTRAHGVFVGHVDALRIEGCDITGQGAAPSPDRAVPQFGVYQYGWRGPRLTMSANSVTNLHFGFAVLPDIKPSSPGVWRLLHNATRGVVRPYAVTGNVVLA
ncbi:MAG: DUF6519 domain-containing protein [Pseudomonadota bacterium]